MFTSDKYEFSYAKQYSINEASQDVYDGDCDYKRYDPRYHLKYFKINKYRNLKYEISAYKQNMVSKN